MTQSVYCKCGAGFEVKEEHLGKWGRCPLCAEKVVIRPGAPPPRIPAPSPNATIPRAPFRRDLSDWALTSLLVAFPLLCIVASVAAVITFQPEPALATNEPFEFPEIPNDIEADVVEPAPPPAEFDANDFDSTVRWIALLCSRVEEARQSQNEDLHVKEWNAVNKEFARVTGTQVQWQIPVGSLRQGFLSFARPTTAIDPFGKCTVYVSTFGQEYEWPPPALRQRPFPGNSVERNRLPFRGEAQISLGPGEVPGLETTFVGDTLSLRAGNPVLVRGKASLSMAPTDWEVDIVISEATIDTSTKAAPSRTSKANDTPAVMQQLDQDQDELLRELQQGFDRIRDR